MGLPQILVLFLYAASWTVAVLKNGEPTRYSAGANTISVIILLTLLYWGGFFS